MMNLAMTNLATMTFDVVPGVMVGVLGPALGVIAAVALCAMTYGFATLAAASLRRPDRPTHEGVVPPVAAVRRPEWEITPTITLMLRSACDRSRAR